MSELSSVVSRESTSHDTTLIFQTDCKSVVLFAFSVRWTDIDMFSDIILQVVWVLLICKTQQCLCHQSITAAK